MRLAGRERAGEPAGRLRLGTGCLSGATPPPLTGVLIATLPRVPCTKDSEAWASSSSSLPALLRVPLVLGCLGAPCALAEPSQPWHPDVLLWVGREWTAGRAGGKDGGRERTSCPAASLDAEARPTAAAAVLFLELLGCVHLSGFAEAGSTFQGQAGGKPSLLGAGSEACFPSATMSSCSKRCKLGFVKFAQTIFKLITGTLSKGRKPGLDLACCAMRSDSVWQACPCWHVRVSEEAGRHRRPGFRAAENLGPGSEQAGTGPGSSAGSNCLELWKCLGGCVAAW